MLRSLTLALSLLCLCLCASANDNMYTTCSTNGGLYESYYYIYPGDAHLLHLPSSQHYAVPLTSDNQTMLYFNVCGATDICQGGMACMIDNTGVPTVYAYPNSNPYYYSYNGEIQLNYGYDVGAHYNSFDLQIECGSSPFAVENIYYFDDEEINISISSSYVCDSSQLTYQLPLQYQSLSGPIFMSGKIQMFSMDSVSLDSEQATFVGTFYYSNTLNSFKINGTLSNNNGESNQVSYYYDGSEYLDNPPIMISEVYLPNQSQSSCVLLPNTFDDDDQFEGWFSTRTNAAYTGQRNYTSVYFNKGSTFPVDTWAPSSLQNKVYFTLMERASDGTPVNFGFKSLAPFIDAYDDPTFISEIDWSNLSTETLDSNTFTIPSNCLQ